MRGRELREVGLLIRPTKVRIMVSIGVVFRLGLSTAVVFVSQLMENLHCNKTAEPKAKSARTLSATMVVYDLFIRLFPTSLPARKVRYKLISVVLAVSVCLSVCPSVTSRYCVKTAERFISSFLTQMLPLAYS